MSSTLTHAPEGPAAWERAVFSEPDTSRAWWFLGTLAVLRNPEGTPRTPAVIELTIPPGGSPPSHVHDVLDDAFLVLDGEVVVRCGERTIVGRPGTYVCVPAGAEHTFRVTSRVPARLLLVHGDDSFLALVEAIGTPTLDLRLPPAGEFDLDLDTLVRRNAEHDSRIVGPSLDDGEARAFLPDGAGPTLGALHHVSLNVTDLRRSEPWYTHAFDLVRVEGEVADDGSGHVVLMSPTGGWLLSLTGASAPAVDHLAITCTDRNELVEWRDLLAERAAAPGSITDAPYGSGFVLRDPDGLEIELFATPPVTA